MRIRCALTAFLFLMFVGSVHSQEKPTDKDLATAISTLREVGKNGEGTSSARTALKSAAAARGPQLLAILKGFGQANPLAANWLRSAFETAAAATLSSGSDLPAKQIEEFVLDTKQDARARRMAYEWLSQTDKKLGDRIIPQLLLDPSPEFRRDAVARLIKSGEAAQETDRKDEAIAAFTKAMSGAVHADQVDTLAEALEELGKSVNIQKHFGFLPEWQVIGPFDNKDKKGFPIAYPPESAVDLSAEYDGQLGKVQWKKYSTDDPYGVFDIAKQIENHKGSCMYAYTKFESANGGDVELRLGTPNAWKLWLNGKLVFEREEYHRSTQMDQYRMTVNLKAGTNTILLKVCQNEQTQEWAQRYQYQLRVCDSTGQAIAPVVKTSAVP